MATALRAALLSLAAAAALLAGEGRVAAAGRRLVVQFFSAGHADSALLTTASGKRILIDAGRGDESRLRDDLVRRRIVPLIAARRIRRLDALVITHPHWDHTGDPVELARRVEIAAIYVNADGESWLGPQLRRLAPTRRLARGDRLRFGELSLEVLWPPRRLGAPTDHISAINNRSLVLRAVYGKTRILFAGDLTYAGERRLLRATSRPGARGRTDAPLRADALKLGHHGVLSTSDRWLRAVRPSVAIATCGERWSGRIDRLSRGLIRRLARRAVRLYRTDRDGDVVLQSDGQRLQVTTSPRHRCCGRRTSARPPRSAK